MNAPNIFEDYARDVFIQDTAACLDLVELSKTDMFTALGEHYMDCAEQLGKQAIPPLGGGNVES
jgi:hypothetical protein